MKGFPPYSVLMSVYAKEKPEFLLSAINSMWEQTVQPSEFVLVCDGPLSTGLDKVIADMEKTYPDKFRCYRLKVNHGLGDALNYGLKKCTNEFIARMDSDDISSPERCELQLEQFASNPHLSFVSGTVLEFSTNVDEIEAERVLPETQDEILVFAKKRNPINHPCVMYRKSSVDAAGGYQSFYLLEDYYLWLRMLQAGCVGYNIQKPLLRMRAGSEMYMRRSGLKYAGSQAKLFRYMFDVGFISRTEYYKSVITRGLVSIAPNSLRKAAFKILARS